MKKIKRFRHLNEETVPIVDENDVEKISVVLIDNGDDGEYGYMLKVKSQGITFYTNLHRYDDDDVEYYEK